MNKSPALAVVIPAYKVRRHVLGVIAGIGPEVDRIYVVDDACPDRSGDWVRSQCTDVRVTVIRHESNQGVGGAVLTGYAHALAESMDIVVKVDGDGQMDPALIPDIVFPIAVGQADYTKGNRFYELKSLRSMPKIRLLGNAALSFVSKLSSGYWNLFDPTNGYTAVHRGALERIPLEKISRRYFFESDMLFHLNIVRAVVVDVPMQAIYGAEQSNLKIWRVLPDFLRKHSSNFFKRIFYNYYLRDMSVASFELPLGLLMLIFGVGFGSLHWIDSAVRGQSTPAGTVVLAALPVILGSQLLLAFLAYDIANVPRRTLHRMLGQTDAIRSREGD